MKQIVILVFISIFFVSCLKDAEIETFVDVPSQILVHNSFYVQGVSHDKTSWLVVRRDNSTGVSGMVIKPIKVNAGTYYNFTIPVDSGVNVSNNEYFRVILHEDTGLPGEFEYTGTGGNDQPIANERGVVEDRFYIRAPVLSIKDQVISNDSLAIDSVVVGVNSWLVIYKADVNENIGDEVGGAFVFGGITKNRKMKLDSTILPGTKLISRLHLDFQPYQVFTDETDIIEVFNNDSLETTFSAE